MWEYEIPSHSIIMESAVYLLERYLEYKKAMFLQQIWNLKISSFQQQIIWLSSLYMSVSEIQYIWE